VNHDETSRRLKEAADMLEMWGKYEPASWVRGANKDRDRWRECVRVYGGHIPPCQGRPCQCGFAKAWEMVGLP
jgi:hypothetical protein